MASTDVSPIRHEHLVQLFDSEESLEDAVSAFLAEGFSNGDTLLVVIDQQHWYSIAMRLSREGVAVDEALRSERLIVRDAAEMLDSFTRSGTLDPDVFDASVGGLVRALVSRGSGLRVYGEMVNLLAGRGDFRHAQRLEDLWNQLREQVEFTLFCGYSAAHFGDPRFAEALRGICRAHSAVTSNPRDLLGTFLLNLHQIAQLPYSR